MRLISISYDINALRTLDENVSKVVTLQFTKIFDFVIEVTGCILDVQILALSLGFTLVFKSFVRCITGTTKIYEYKTKIP